MRGRNGPHPNPHTSNAINATMHTSTPPPSLVPCAVWKKKKIDRQKMKEVAGRLFKGSEKAPRRYSFVFGFFLDLVDQNQIGVDVFFFLFLRNKQELLILL